MSGGPVVRLQREIAACAKDAEISGVNVLTVSDSLTHLRGTIVGPKDSPYEGGVFHVDIRIGEQYPFAPPKMQFITKVWHPNVSSQTGAICLDILKDQWSPALTIKTALLSIQALLTAAEPDDPQDAEVAGMYKTNRALFDDTARRWTQMYAKEASDDEKVKSLTAMGFGERDVRAALVRAGGDTEAAAEILLSA